MRTELLWNQEWTFYKGEDIVNAVWEAVTLPHTWNAYDGQDGGGDYYQGSACYSKVFHMDKKQKTVYIRVGAANKKAEVWCNKEFVGEHLGGFSAFCFELTPYLKIGDNKILIKVNNSNELSIYPYSADFTFFGGIYRDVKLITFDNETHFDVTTYGVDAVFVTSHVSGQVEIKAKVTTTTVVNATIYDAQDREVVSCHKTSDSTQVYFNMSVQSPHIWNGLDNPYLYKVKLTIDGCDEVCVSFGFRSYEVTKENGFFLNGKSYPLHGVCRHQDREDKGWAISKEDQIEDMDIIREIGANTIRLAHYQHSSFFYDLCDKAGMVVWAEIPFISMYKNRPEADENLRVQLRELIYQNYNHTCICFWGIANEIGICGESKKQYDILLELNRMAKELDPQRLTAIANVGMTKPESPLFHTTDVATYNEYMGWYEGTADDHGTFCDEKHKELSDVPLGISEYGADAVLSWHSETPKCKDYTEEYQAIVHEKAEQAFAHRPYLWATWLWNMFDFAADARDEGGCKGRNNKGLVTYDRKVKKQAFFYYKAKWGKEPFVYICGKRFTVRANEEIIIKVYSNLKNVTLFVNGEEVGTKEGEVVFEFPVHLCEGINEIKAVSSDGSIDTLTLTKADKLPKEYTLVVEKAMSANVAQWFANMQTEAVKEIVVKEGYLSVYDPLEEVYKYPDGYAAVLEIIRTPLSVDQPAMAERMATGGAMSFHSIWNHINKMLPDEAYYILNDRLNKIKR
jgi:beta-galactosidase